jgi:hypothetical protein
MACPIHDLRGFLTGSWRISRRVRDFRLGICGRLEGRMTIAPDPGGLVQDEAGWLRFGGHQGGATSRYLIGIERPTQASIRHADGRPFHALDLSTGIADIQHQCAEDHYRGRYRVLHPDSYLVTWHVTGPRKHYRLATRHVRMAPGI